jgi:hypothetical protein
MSYFSHRGVVYRCEHNLGSSLYPSLVISFTQVMRYELVFLTIRNRVGFLIQLICFFLKGCEQRLALWSIPFHKRFRKRLQSLRCDLTVPCFSSHRSNAFLRVILLMALAKQLTAVLHAGSRVTCHSFLNLLLCFNTLFRPDGSLFRSNGVIFLADRLHAKL